MNSIEANTRDTKTKGELNLLRNNGHVPAIIYGGEAQNQTAVSYTHLTLPTKA